MEARTRALRESEAALTQAASEWRRTFDAIDSPVMILDLEGRMVRANATVRGLTGKGAKSGVTGRSWPPWARASRGRPRRGWQRRRTWPDRPGRPRRVDPATGRSFDVSAYLMEPEEGGDGRIIVVAKDTTRLLELRETLRREENMSAMGALVAGVAHEVRNPIFAISSTLDAFEARFGDTPELEKYFPVLRREVDRLGDLMRDLLDYGRPPQMETAAVALRGVVAEAIRTCCEIGENGIAGHGGQRRLRRPARGGRGRQARRPGVPQRDPQCDPAHARGRGGRGEGESARRRRAPLDRVLGARHRARLPPRGPAARVPAALHQASRGARASAWPSPSASSRSTAGAMRCRQRARGRRPGHGPPSPGPARTARWRESAAMARNRVLVVDDEPGVPLRPPGVPRGQGVRRGRSRDLRRPRRRCSGRRRPDVAILDYSLPDGNALRAAAAAARARRVRAPGRS